MYNLNVIEYLKKLEERFSTESLPKVAAIKYQELLNKLGMNKYGRIKHNDLDLNQSLQEEDWNEVISTYAIVVAVKKIKEIDKNEFHDLPIFIKNTSTLDKALVAFLNCIGNEAFYTIAISHHSILDEYFKEAEKLSPVLSAEALENDIAIKAINLEFLNLIINDISLSSEYDFIGYVSIIDDNGMVKLVELDGSKKCPLLRRMFTKENSEGFIRDARKEIRTKVDDGEISKDFIVFTIGEILTDDNDNVVLLANYN